MLSFSKQKFCFRGNTSIIISEYFINHPWLTDIKYLPCVRQPRLLNKFPSKFEIALLKKLTFKKISKFGKRTMLALKKLWFPFDRKSKITQKFRIFISRRRFCAEEWGGGLGVEPTVKRRRETFETELFFYIFGIRIFFPFIIIIFPMILFFIQPRNYFYGEISSFIAVLYFQLFHFFLFFFFLVEGSWNKLFPNFFFRFWINWDDWKNSISAILSRIWCLFIYLFFFVDNDA